MKIDNDFKNKLVIWIFFFSWVAIGLTTYKDFGISWDENFSRELNGMKSYKFLTGEDKKDYLNCSERYHGPIFELFLYKLEVAFHWTDSRDIFLNRHLVTYLFYLLGAFCLFKLSKEIFSSDYLGFFAATLFLLYPKLFPDAFYNSKDSANTSFMAISLYSMYKFVVKPSFRNVVFHAMIVGIIVGIRISSIIVPLISIVAFFIRNLVIRKSDSTFNIIKLGFLFLTFSIGFIVLFWPVLWINPIEQFVIAWTEMSKFNWISTTIFLDEFVWSNKLPWYYIPVWISLTTPIYYLFLFGFGVLFIIIDFLKNWKSPSDTTIIVLISFSIFILPLCAVIYLHSVLYDGWRHLYFIYPSFVIVATYCAFKIYSYFNSYKNLIKIALSIPFIFVAYDMVKLHPYQHLFINKIYYSSIEDSRFKMEMDYWGLTYKNGLEWIVNNDNRDSIKVKADNTPGELNAMIIDKKQRSRLIFVKNESEADYLIGNYRWRRSEYELQNEVYSITVDGAKVLAVFKLN